MCNEGTSRATIIFVIMIVVGLVTKSIGMW